MIKLPKTKRASSVLGISLDGNRLEAVVMRRNGSLQIQQTLSVPLALSPLSGDPELVGREIRNHLDQAGIRERRCAVCLPLNWVLTVQTKLPDLPEEDIASFLALESERGFPSGHENLYIADSRVRVAGGEQYATLLGIPRNHIAILERALKAAQLKPLTFSIGITALAAAGTESQPGLLTLGIAPHGIDLQVSAGGGIAALRSLDGALDTDAALKGIDADLVAREIRITLGQLPAAFGKDVRLARIYSRGEIARQFNTDIARRLEGMGLKVELMDRASDAQFSTAPSPDIALSPALALAANFLRSGLSRPEFLPPKVHPWQQFINNNLASRKFGWVGAAAGGAAAIVIIAFLIQQWQISRLENRWHGMSAQVAELSHAQDQIRRFRPWYDRSFRAMRIMKAITEAFPEAGYVSAKNLEIHDLSNVTCSGVARDNQSYLALLAKLRADSEVTDLKTEMVRGQAPVQFTLNFQWEANNATGN